MSSPPLRGTAEWSANREVALLLGLAGGNRRRAQWLWLQKERIKAEASQFASAGAPPASQQPAGCRAEPAAAKAQGVPKRRSAAQLAQNRRRLNLARCGPTCEWRADCSHGSLERALRTAAPTRGQSLLMTT